MLDHNAARFTGARKSPTVNEAFVLLRSLILSVSLFNLFGSVAQAQHAESPIAANSLESIGCTRPADTARLRLTLPLDVLDQLDRMSNSVFVDAFLIRQIADSSAGNHPLSKCAREFIKAPLTDLRKLRDNLPEASAILDALRNEELARQRTKQLLDSAPSFAKVVAQLRTDMSAANLDASADVFIKAKSRCTDHSDVCKTIARATAQLDTLRRARSAEAAAQALARQSGEAAANATNHMMVALSAFNKDSLLKDSLESAQRKDTGMVDPASLAETQSRIDRWKSVDDSLKQVVAQRSRAASQADTAWQDSLKIANSVQSRLIDTLGTLDTQLKSATDKVVKKISVATQGIKLSGALATDVAAKPIQAPAPNPTARPANLILAMTDFIIARARQEAVISFIINLHIFAQHEPLVRIAFPDTWGLMQSLPARSDGRLNAVDVGRVPLNVWRAILADDFVEAPIRLLETEPGALCHRRLLHVDKRDVANPRDEETCRKRVASLRPLGPIADRLLAGDGVFDILQDADSYAPLQGPDATPSWRRLTQGLAFLGELAQTFVVQGLVQSPDVTRNPYLLTSRAVTQVPQQQRDAFLRLLLVEAKPATSDVPAVIDEAALTNGIAGTVRILERLGSRSTVGETPPLSASQVVHDEFEALVSAADIARILAPDPAPTQLDTLKARWREVSGVIEPMVAHDFGLALSRTTVLLRELQGRDLPRSFVTFTTLASSLSEAQTAEQVRGAFETAASPVGGWQSKRYGEGGASITAFPGLAAGMEKVLRRKTDAGNVGDAAFAAGVSLPVGVEWQRRHVDDDGRGVAECHVHVCGIGAFVPIVDLGALLSYRFGGSDNVQSEPNATFRQVFAPGLYLSLALTRTVPANLLVGAELMPSLRKVTQGTETTVNRSAVRFGVGLGLDVMLFDF